MTNNGDRPDEEADQKREHVDPPSWAHLRNLKPYDIVGTREAAELLNVERTRIGKWKKRGIMPPCVKELEATPVWRAKDVTAMIPWVEANRRPAKVREPA